MCSQHPAAGDGGLGVWQRGEQHRRSWPDLDGVDVVDGVQLSESGVKVVNRPVHGAGCEQFGTENDDGGT